MSSRPAARGSEAARSIRLAQRTSSMVAVSSASPSRCFLFWPGRRARIASLIVLATVAIPPTTQPHPLPIRPHAPRRRLGCAAQETMGGEGPRGRPLAGGGRTEHAGRMPRLSIRVDLGPGLRIGPGKIALLEAIDATGSISAAGRKLGMSYRRGLPPGGGVERPLPPPGGPAPTRGGGGRGGPPPPPGPRADHPH